MEKFWHYLYAAIITFIGVMLVMYGPSEFYAAIGLVLVGFGAAWAILRFID